MIVIALICLLQYAFLSRLWNGYITQYAGNLIRSDVAQIAVSLVMIGAVLIGVLSLKRWSQGDRAARNLERPATHPSFNAVKELLQDVWSRSSMPEVPTMYYTPKNANALEVRQSRRGPGTIVVGLSKRTFTTQEAGVLAAQIGHEVSHLEFGETHHEIRFRRAISLHFKLLGFSILMYLATVAFIDRNGISDDDSISDLRLAFDIGIYTQIAGQLTALALSCLVVYLYSFYFLVRREHLHDLRGHDLSGRAISARDMFEPGKPVTSYYRLLRVLRDFFSLHPSRNNRIRIVEQGEFLLVSAFVYPLLVSTLQPLVLLLTAGWREFFSVERPYWNLGLTISSGLMLFALLRSDIVRLAIGALTKPKRYIALIPVYALMVGLATQIPRVVLEINFGLQRAFPFSLIIERIWEGSTLGGLNVIIMTAGALITTVYVSAVSLAATGIFRPTWVNVFENIVSATLVVCAFTIMSLGTPSFSYM